jgi:hypothetical protein
MDEMDLQLQRRLEALSDAVPVPAAHAPGRTADGHRSMAGRRWSPGLGWLAALGLLLVVGGWGLLALGGEVSGILSTVGGPIGYPDGYIGTGDADAGYWDTPCGTDGLHCPSPVPTIDPAVSAQGRPLEVASASVTVDHAGHYSIPLGTAILPNGVLTDATFTITEPVQPTIELEPSEVYLVVTGDDGNELLSVYEQGWRPGVEQVTASLEFDVASVDAATTLEFTGIVVR